MKKIRNYINTINIIIKEVILINIMLCWDKIKYFLKEKTEYIFLNYIFVLYKYITDSLFTIIILIITWLLIRNSTVQIITDFRVEFFGITYTILIVDFSIYIRTHLENIKLKNMFVKASLNLIDMSCYHLTREFKVDIKKSIRDDYDLIVHNLCGANDIDLTQNLKSISAFFEHFEKQIKQIIESYSEIISIELKSDLMDTMFRINNNNLFKLHNIEKLLVDKNPENLNYISYKLTRLYIASMTDEERISTMLCSILRSNVQLFFDLTDNLHSIEKQIRKNYNPFFNHIVFSKKYY